MTEIILHASAVAVRRRGLLILGRSGAGKSSLALDMIGRGARLVSDDRVIVQRRGDLLFANAPATIRGRIEMRGLGILAAETEGDVPLALAIDLDSAETTRLPEPRWMQLLDLPLRLLFRPETPLLGAGLMQWLTAGEAPDE